MTGIGLGLPVAPPNDPLLAGVLGLGLFTVGGTTAGEPIAEGTGIGEFRLPVAPG